MHKSPVSTQEFATTATELINLAQFFLGLSQESFPNNSQPVQSHKPEDLYRCYRVSSNVLSEEAELLAEYETDNIAEVLLAIQSEIHLMVKLMDGYAWKHEDEDFTYAMIAEHLGRPLDRLAKASSVLGGFKPEIQK